ncbi:hypothetical protein NL676_034417 [Syzygium grande]|nr:hypothetical protein NL676_034417 [Syzygium grande]
MLPFQPQCTLALQRPSPVPQPNGVRSQITLAIEPRRLQFQKLLYQFRHWPGHIYRAGDGILHISLISTISIVSIIPVIPVGPIGGDNGGPQQRAAIVASLSGQSTSRIPASSRALRIPSTLGSSAILTCGSLAGPARDLDLDLYLFSDLPRPWITRLSNLHVHSPAIIPTSGSRPNPS